MKRLGLLRQPRKVHSSNANRRQGLHHATYSRKGEIGLSFPDFRLLHNSLRLYSVICLTLGVLWRAHVSPLFITPYILGLSFVARFFSCIASVLNPSRRWDLPFVSVIKSSLELLWGSDLSFPGSLLWVDFFEYRSSDFSAAFVWAIFLLSFSGCPSLPLTLNLTYKEDKTSKVLGTRTQALPYLTGVLN